MPRRFDARILESRRPDAGKVGATAGQDAGNHVDGL